MKQVNYVSYLKDPKKYMGELPIALMVAGKVKSVILKPEDVSEPTKAAAPTVEKELTGDFDWRTAEVCQACGNLIPKILAPYHMHVKHGL